MFSNKPSKSFISTSRLTDSGPMTHVFGGVMSPGVGMCGLSKTERLYAFGICFIAGMILSILGTILLIIGNLTAFAIMYSVGNVLSLFSMGFLLGFARQIKLMFKKIRVIATIVYLITLVLTFVVAFTVQIGAVCLVLVVIQFCALVWYSASYIPYGQKMIKGTCGTCIGAV